MKRIKNFIYLFYFTKCLHFSEIRIYIYLIEFFNEPERYEKAKVLGGIYEI